MEERENVFRERPLQLEQRAPAFQVAQDREVPYQEPHKPVVRMVEKVEMAQEAMLVAERAILGARALHQHM